MFWVPGFRPVNSAVFPCGQASICRLSALYYLSCHGCVQLAPLQSRVMKTFKSRWSEHGLDSGKSSQVTNSFCRYTHFCSLHSIRSYNRWVHFGLPPPSIPATVRFTQSCHGVVNGYFFAFCADHSWSRSGYQSRLGLGVSATESGVGVLKSLVILAFLPPCPSVLSRVGLAK